MLQTETSTAGDNPMVQLTRHEPVPEYRIMNEDGQPIGRVVDPAMPPRIRLGGETVLLVR
jgi:hypothetical protein